MARSILNRFFVFAFLFFPIVVSAADLGLGNAGGIGLQGNLTGIIANVIKVALGLVGVLALAYIVYGGFLYISAAGDAKQIDKAKTVIIYAVIGIIVIGISYALVQFVIGAIGGGSGGGAGGGTGGGLNG